MSPAVPSQTSLFGIELADLWKILASPWRNLQDSAVLRWLAPQPEVRVIQADGRESVWAGAHQLTARIPETVSFMAVEIPEDLYLRRKLSLPPMGEADLRDAVALDVQAASPFGSADLVWGYKARLVSGQQSVDVVLASRKQIAQHLKTLASKLPAGGHPEVWVRSVGGDPIILPGYGEDRRARYTGSRWKLGVALLVLAAGLLTAIAVTPTVQLRLQAIQATQASEEAARRAQPLLRKREQMVQASAEVALLNSIMAQRVEPAYAMDYLTRIIPDDTSLLSLNIQGNKAVLTGQTANAAALMQRLSSEPGLREVRAPSPAIRPMGSTKETFTVEFTFDARPPASTASPVAGATPGIATPAQIPPAASAPVAASPGSASPPLAGASPPATLSAVPAPAATAAAPVAAPAPVTPSPATGGFTIGGTRPKPAPAAAASGAKAAP